LSGGVEMNRNESIIAIIIAAGLSERMGGFKPLLELGGRPALFRLLDTIREAGIETAVVVTGHEHALIEEAVKDNGDGLILSHCYNVTKSDRPHCLSDKRQDKGTVLLSCCPWQDKRTVPLSLATRLFLVNNPAYRDGMFSSVKAGVRKAAEILESRDPHNRDVPFCAARCALLFPTDVPLVSAETITGLIRAWESSPAGENDSHKKERPCCAVPFAVPVYKGKNGHPLLIPEMYFDEILCYEGVGGLKGVRGKYDESLVKYETDDEGCVLDMDTREDYSKLIKYMRSRHI